MAGEFKLTVAGIEGLREELAKLAPELRRGPARRALVNGAEPVLARAIALTPILAADVYVRGKLYRKSGTLRRALRIRSSKDTNATGDVGVFINFKPLKKGAVADFKAATGRKGSANPDDPFYFRWTIFSTKRNPNPKRSLQIGGELLQSEALPLISNSLKAYFERLNRRKGGV